MENKSLAGNLFQGMCVGQGGSWAGGNRQKSHWEPTREPEGLLCDLGQVTAPFWSHFPPLETKWGREWGDGAPWSHFSSHCTVSVSPRAHSTVKHGRHFKVGRGATVSSPLALPLETGNSKKMSTLLACWPPSYPAHTHTTLWEKREWEWQGK